MPARSRLPENACRDRWCGIYLHAVRSEEEVRAYQEPGNLTVGFLARLGV